MRLAGRSSVRSVSFGRKACAYLSQSSSLIRRMPIAQSRYFSLPRVPAQKVGCPVPACISSPFHALRPAPTTGG
eukprot:10857657-Alexandrium_andersonii.AAC.1